MSSAITPVDLEKEADTVDNMSKGVHLPFEAPKNPDQEMGSVEVEDTVKSKGKKQRTWGEWC